jgi:GTP-binding nuclear protein Ran
MNIVILGDPGVGKTSFINIHRMGKFKKKYKPTKGIEMCPISIESNNGYIVDINIWEFPCVELSKMQLEYWKKSNIFIIMFDLENKMSHKNIPKWYNMIVNFFCENHMDIPFIILCGNKCDIKTFVDLKYRFEYKLPYYEISVKDKYNIITPFLDIINIVLKNEL